MLKKIELSDIIFLKEVDIQWPWNRVLCSIDYVPLQSATALQYVILSVLTSDEITQDLTIQEVASNLGVEQRIIEEGLNDLIECKFIIIKPRVNKALLSNYSVDGLCREIFSLSQAVPGQKSHQKISLFYASTDAESSFTYQLIERKKDNNDKPKKNLDFAFVIIYIIEQIIQKMGENKQISQKICDININSSLNKHSKQNRMFIQNIGLNFL